MSKFPLSETSSKLPENNEVRSFEVTSDGNNGNSLSFQDDSVKAGTQEDTAREKAVRTTEYIAQSIQERASSPYYAIGSWIRNMSDLFVKKVFAVTDPEENESKENEIRQIDLSQKKNDLSELDKKIKSNPGHHGLHEEKAELLRAMGEHEAAAKEYDLEVTKNPKYTNKQGTIARKSKNINHNINRLYEKIAREENTLFWCDELLKHDPENSKFLIIRGDMHRDSGHYDDALKDYDESIDPGYVRPSISDSIIGGNLEGFTRKIQLYRTLGKYEDALSTSNEFIEKCPDNLKTFAYLGRMNNNFRLGRPKDVFEDLARVASENPGLSVMLVLCAVLALDGVRQPHDPRVDLPTQPLQFRDEKEYTRFIQNYAEGLVTIDMLDIKSLTQEERSGLLKMEMNQAGEIFEEIAKIKINVRFSHQKGASNAESKVHVIGANMEHKESFQHSLKQDQLDLSNAQIKRRLRTTLVKQTVDTIKNFISEKVLGDIQDNDESKTDLENILFMCAQKILENKVISTEKEASGKNYQNNFVYNRVLPQDVKHAKLDQEMFTKVFNIFSEQVAKSLTQVHSEVVKEYENLQARSSDAGGEERKENDREHGPANEEKDASNSNIEKDDNPATITTPSGTSILSSTPQERGVSRKRCL